MARLVAKNVFVFKLGRHVFRHLSTMSDPAQEIVIPTCSGHVAGKAWGPENGRKVLALHGWQDNCGTFDTLIPLLPKHLRIVAVDFPGHGLSSHKPQGTVYSFFDLLLDVKYISTQMNWNKYSLMAHSMGGAVSMIYASCFPDEIEAVATLDGVDSDNAPSFKKAEQMAYLINRIFTYNTKLGNPAPVYSYEGAYNRLLEGQKTFMTGVGVSHLLKRAIKPLETDKNSFVFTRDIRLQAFNFQPTTPDLWISYLQSLKCNLLRVKAKNGVKPRSTNISDFLEQNCKEKGNYRMVEVEGLHHVHLEEPEKVAPYLCEFFAENNQLTNSK